MERLFVFADFNWLGKAELVGELCYEKNCQNLGFRQESLSFSPKAAAMWVKMVERANALITFWDGMSTRTKQLIDMAIAKQIPVKIIRY